jgi:hypothetical protein
MRASTRKYLAKADKGWIEVFEMLVIRPQCKIAKTGKTLETSRNSDQ